MKKDSTKDNIYAGTSDTFIGSYILCGLPGLGIN